ncbi:hypothetical protein QE152_g31459 [Popillia japonica]|uniref:Macro domain-containing protein n=1 Tax=Popillia japonica TaxID=7064 RepID=A0AAW1J217_POPJA
MINTVCYSYNINGSGNCIANLCNDVENYPYDEIRKALAKYPEYKIYSGVVVAIPNRGRRGIGGEDQVAGELCSTRVNKMLPRIGIDIKKDFRTIVNTEEYKQEVPYITCG